MTAKLLFLDPELAGAYPNAQRAVLLVENIYTATDPRDFWGLMRKYVERNGFDAIIQMLTKTSQGQHEKGISPDTPDPDYMIKAMNEFRTEDFRRYLAAKLRML